MYVVCGRSYRVVVPNDDFGDYLIPGGQARFTAVEGGYGNIFNLPLQFSPLGVEFEFTIHPNASGGMMIAVDGLQVRARVPTASEGSDEEEEDDESDFDVDEPGPWLPTTGPFGGDGGAGGSAGVVA